MIPHQTREINISYQRRSHIGLCFNECMQRMFVHSQRPLMMPFVKNGKQYCRCDGQSPENICRDIAQCCLIHVKKAPGKVHERMGPYNNPQAIVPLAIQSEIV
jgi:hypothetical protein